MVVRQIFFRGVTHGVMLGILWLGCSAVAHAQQTRTRAPKAHRRLPAPQVPWEQIPQQGAYSGDEPGVAAGRLIDSLFNPTAPESPVPEILSQALGRSPYRGAARRSSLRGRLVRNPDTINGSAPFVLLDRYGGIQRYIEPVTDIDLEMYEGEIVGVRRDTGDTLLASQLELPRTPGKRTGLQLVDHEEPIPAGEPIPVPTGENSILAEDNIGQEDPLIIPEGVDPLYLDDGLDPLYLDDGLDLGGCPSCGGFVVHEAGCVRGTQNRFYVRGEYMLWVLDGMRIPGLVVLDNAGNTNEFFISNVAYGNEKILEDARSGARVQLGMWFEESRWGLEGEYFGLGTISSQFTAGGDGVTPPFIGRPFIDASADRNPGENLAVELVSFPDPGVQGNVTVNSQSKFGAGGVWFRRHLYTTAGCEEPCVDDISCDSGVGCGTGVGRGRGPACRWFSRCGRLFNRGTRRLDFLFGFRLARLEEDLGITENLRTLGQSPTTFRLNDQFSTTNDFTGFEIGYLWGWQNRRWSLDLTSKLAIGGTRQQVDINGNTVRVPGDPMNEIGGLLALPSNIGSYQRDEFSVLPQLGATLGFALTRRLRLTAGYNFFYWSNVVRPGDQIDLALDKSQIPRFDGTSDQAVLPRFVFHETGLWAQGLNIGADYRW